MPYSITIDTKEITKLTDAIRGLHRSAFPVAVRQTLNDLAFETKQKQLIPMANKTFTVRDSNFFKAFSKVDRAAGLNVGAMTADAGMLDKGAAQTFDEQEKGGDYTHEYVPNTQARSGGNNKAKINKANYRGNGKMIDRSLKTKNRSRKSQFTADAAMGFKLKKLINHNGTIFKVLKFSKDEYGIRIKLKPLYDAENNRKVSVKPTHFIEKTATKAAEKTERFYKRAANQQFKKYFRD